MNYLDPQDAPLFIFVETWKSVKLNAKVTMTILIIRAAFDTAVGASIFVLKQNLEKNTFEMVKLQSLQFGDLKETKKRKWKGKLLFKGTFRRNLLILIFQELKPPGKHVAAISKTNYLKCKKTIYQFIQLHYSLQKDTAIKNLTVDWYLRTFLAFDGQRIGVRFGILCSWTFCGWVFNEHWHR